MNFTFLKNNNIKGLTDKIADRIIEINEIDYRLEYLNSEVEGNKGGNSAIFKLINTEDEEEELVIKFLKFPYTANDKGMNARFDREINALKKAKDKNFENLIDIVSEGFVKIEKRVYRYYVMEKAETDLGSYITSSENSLALSEKVKLGYEIIKGIRQLHQLDIYHRDIKPDNIFLVRKGDGGSIWKIGDLGLLSYRGEDLNYEKGKKIGPGNWLSPEAMNNALCGNSESSFDTLIDNKSDVFQLGNVLWFIFNHNAPVGQVTIDDFLIKDYTIFSLIFTMIRHKKHGRRDVIFYEEYFLQLDSLYLSNRKNSSQWFTRKCRKILRLN